MTLFFFNDTATTEIYTLSLHDALPIYFRVIVAADAVDSMDGEDMHRFALHLVAAALGWPLGNHEIVKAHRCMSSPDRKSTRLNSSHSQISYAVFCLKKKNTYGPAQCRY